MQMMLLINSDVIDKVTSFKILRKFRNIDEKK